MRRATTLLLMISIAALALVPAHAQNKSQQVRIINGIGLVDYSGKPTFKPGDWVTYHMTGSSALGASDDYKIMLTIAGEEEFWGEDCFWVETISLQDGIEVNSVASLMSYAVFDEPEAVTQMKTYVRKQVNGMTDTGVPIQNVVRRPSSAVRSRETVQSKLDYYIDSLGTEEIEIPNGKYVCDKILFKQAAGASVDFADSSRYEEVREHRTIFRTRKVPITSIAIEQIENVVSRKTWVRGKSTDAPEVIRDRALGRAIAQDWGTGHKSQIIDEALQKTLAEQRAEARRKPAKKPRSS